MFIAYVESVQTGIAYPAVNDGQFFSGLFPLAPITEQYHIVAKVDELMALCDQLEAERNTREATHQQLIRAVHHPLTEAADTASTQTAWHRIRRNFSNLYTTLESVQALRQTILQLAVQGKLLPQDPSDEPASELLKRIQAEKARLVAEGKIKNQNPLPEISEDEKPFELPEGWEWVRLGTLGSCSTGKTPSTRNPEYYGEDIPFIGPGQITTDGDITSPEKFLSILGKSETTVADANDILMVCIGGSIGKCAIASSGIAFNQQINSIKPLLVIPKYSYLSMKSSVFQEKVLSTATGSATPIINRSKWEEIMIPMPPLAEQNRIVAKVDALMALCDQLETNIRTKDETASRYAEAVVQELAA